MMANLWCKADYVDVTRGLRYGEDAACETFTDDRGELYRHCVREFGRCTGKVYIDEKQPDGAYKPRAVGWCFVKRVEYDDADRAQLRGKARTFLREVWVTVLSGPDTVTRTEHFAA